MKKFLFMVVGMMLSLFYSGNVRAATEMNLYYVYLSLPTLLESGVINNSKRYLLPIHVTNLKKDDATNYYADIGSIDFSRTDLGVFSSRAGPPGPRVGPSVPFMETSNCIAITEPKKVGNQFVVTSAKNQFVWDASKKKVCFQREDGTVEPTNPVLSARVNAGKRLTFDEQKQFVLGYQNQSELADMTKTFLIKEALKTLPKPPKWCENAEYPDVNIKDGYGSAESHDFYRYDHYLITLDNGGRIVLDKNGSPYELTKNENTVTSQPLRIEEFIKKCEGHDFSNAVHRVSFGVDSLGLSGGDERVKNALSRVYRDFEKYGLDDSDDSDDDGVGDGVMLRQNPPVVRAHVRAAAPSEEANSDRNVLAHNASLLPQWRFNKQWLAASGGLGALGLGAGGFALNRAQRARRLDRLIAGLQAQQLGNNSQKLRALYRSRRNARWGMYGGSGVSILALIGALLALRHGVGRVDVPV